GMKAKNYRRRSNDVDGGGEEEEESPIVTLEEVQFLQKLRVKKSGIPALVIPPAENSVAAGIGSPSGLSRKAKDKADGDAAAEKDDLVLQDTFAQETAVVVEDPNMLKYIDQELARKRGKHIAASDDNQADNDVKRAEDELYRIPEHLKVKRKRGSGESTTQWTTGIAEIQLPIEYKLRNIEETEAAKKLLQEKRMMGRGK
ncbi:hypothetical protein M569_12673, partial [Genlisea aurea]